jgi:hypothetical protein
MRIATTTAALAIALASAAIAWAQDPFAFAPRVDVPLGPPGCTDDCSDAPFALLAGDFDLNGHLDLATANNGSGDIVITTAAGKLVRSASNVSEPGSNP